MKDKNQSDVSLLEIKVTPGGEYGWQAFTPEGHLFFERFNRDAALTEGQTIFNWLYTLEIKKMLQL